ncbi:hypothetical protein ESCO13_00266 [Escherichia phage ESCO13]|uniref:Uncharacterized protein n=1 Tax=Escherichia phage ESCO13 TaxID=1881104 RepID=A0A1D7XFN5_9CAUD|nr:hypothetical protein HOR21_gp166 [Escherichia phage ESCO13]AOQ27386.1 hypothetical protein ESCO13_00266 [Escherichia phage ESCO13]
MATLHIVAKAGQINVVVNGFTEFSHPQDDHETVLSFIDSLLEMGVITEDQHGTKCKRVNQIAGIE